MNFGWIQGRKGSIPGKEMTAKFQRLDKSCGTPMRRTVKHAPSE